MKEEDIGLKSTPHKLLDVMPPAAAGLGGIYFPVRRLRADIPLVC